MNYENHVALALRLVREQKGVSKEFRRALACDHMTEQEWEAEIQQDAENRDAGLTRYTELGGIE